MARSLMTVLTAALTLAAASGVHAFSMGEVTATTGVHNTLAASGTTRPAGPIAGVKRSLGAAVQTKQAQLNGAAPAGPQGWGGKGGGRAAWAVAGAGGKGWAIGAATGRWATATVGGGWATGGQGAAGAWVSGSWGNRAVN